MKPEDIKDKKIAVTCGTYEKAKRFCEICDVEYSDTLIACRLGMLGSDLCQAYVSQQFIGHDVEFSSKQLYEHRGYRVITFEQFMEDTQEEQLTAVEVLEVLANEYESGKYIEIFGYDPSFSELTSRFTPAEIVQKVTEWKRKQDKQIRVTEDMIAEALDEKYGIGNWGRE